eukprot:g78737.t1
MPLPNIVFTHLCLYAMCLSVRICSIASFVCLCWQDERTALIWAGRNGLVAVAVMLLRAGPITTSDSFSRYVLARDKAGKSALIWARQEGHQEMVQLLEEAPQLPSALLDAAEKGDVNSCTKLIEQGAPLEAKNKNGATALILAGSNGHKEVAEALLQAKAEANAKDKDGKSALDLATANGHTAVIELLSNSTQAQQVPPAAAEAQESQQQGDTSEEKNEARQGSASELPDAAEKGDVDRIRELLAQSVDVDLEARDRDGRTALMSAARESHVAVAEALLQAKAALNTQNNDGVTALMHAGYWGRTEVAALLLKAKADMTLKNGNGRTALDCAREGNKTKAAALLEQYEQVLAPACASCRLPWPLPSSLRRALPQQRALANCEGKSELGYLKQPMTQVGYANTHFETVCSICEAASYRLLLVGREVKIAPELLTISCSYLVSCYLSTRSHRSRLLISYAILQVVATWYRVISSRDLTAAGWASAVRSDQGRQSGGGAATARGGCASARARPGSCSRRTAHRAQSSTRRREVQGEADRAKQEQLDLLVRKREGKKKKIEGQLVR